MKCMVADLLGLRKVVGDIGIEIEVEGRNLPQPTIATPLKHWRKERDGSLRGESAEYVLREPLTLVAAKNALKELDVAYAICGSDVHDSVRAGVHVHVNVQHLTINQLMSFITAYVVVETMLVKWCGKSREGNLFCLRCKDAEAWLNIVEAALTYNNLRLLGTDSIRYSSVNLKALCQYGSVEFRAMRGVRDLDKILLWASLLIQIREKSLSFNNPLELISVCLDNPESFVRWLLDGKQYEDFFYKDFLVDVNTSLRYANDIAHFSEWKEIKMKSIGGLSFPENVEFPDEPLEDF